MAKIDSLPNLAPPVDGSWSAVRRDLEVLGSDIAKLGERSLTDGQEKLSQELDRLKANVADISQKVGDKGKASAESAAELVRRNPLTSVAAAFAVGMLLASLTGRRH